METYFIGFDIGASSIKAVVVKGKKIIRKRISHTPDNLESLLACLIEILGRLTVGINPRKIKGIGFGLAGTFDLERRKVLRSANIKYLTGQSLKKLLQQKFRNYRVELENDVHCFLLAEKKIGQAKKFKSVFYLTLGTGIGGAWMTDRRIFIGAHGAAGEIGHTIINIVNQKGFSFEELAANQFVRGKLGFDAVEAWQRARKGDRRSQAVLDELGRNLGVGLANVINVFDPEAIFLAGGISLAKKFIQN